ncbi:TolB family protein [Micromonospora carbonacea]|uniref:TolB family protein n=1 Tax=Micromonospora carbonacea TaxID=47853 RepID=UPI003D998AC2
MSSPAEEALKAAVRDLARQARPVPDLAAGAIRRGRRLRARRRAAAAAGAALVAVAAVALPFVLLRPDSPVRPAVPEPTATVTPTPELLPTPGPSWSTSPLALPGGWVVTGAGRGGSNQGGSGWVLDRSQGRYLAVQGYTGVWPAPEGTLTALADEDRPGEIGLADSARRRTTWFRTGVWLMQPQWSPDGRRLLLTLRAEGDPMRIGVLDPAGGLDGKGALDSFPVDTDRYFCTDSCFFTWTRDGREVVLQQTGSGAPQSESARHPRRGVQLFSADDGRPTRFVAVPGDPAGPWAWSPDGRLVVVQGQHEPLLVETADGRVVRSLPAADAAFVTDDRLLYRRPYGSRDFVLADPTGRELVRQPLPPELVDRAVTVAPG